VSCEIDEADLQSRAGLYPASQTLDLRFCTVHLDCRSALRHESGFRRLKRRRFVERQATIRRTMRRIELLDRFTEAPGPGVAEGTTKHVDTNILFARLDAPSDCRRRGS
jgi:hypothetical protein